MDGEIFAYWEQGWEGRIEYAFQPEAGNDLFILQNGFQLTIYAADGAVLWSGTIRLVARRFWEKHQLEAAIWNDTKQAGIAYAQWIAWFWHNPPLRARLDV